jgi:hypothetical protein
VTPLSDKSDVHARFDLFERLNTGGVALTAQEVRACILRGPFNDFLRAMADYPPYRRLVKLQKQKQEDGTREELVLKFFGYLNDRPEFKGQVEYFLTEYMKKASSDFSADPARAQFQSVVDTLVDLCGGAFVRQGYSNTPLNQLEAVMVAIAELHAAGTTNLVPAEGWRNDTKLVQTSTGGTNTASMLNARISRAKELLLGASVIG